MTSNYIMATKSVSDLVTTKYEGQKRQHYKVWYNHQTIKYDF